jgi:hypothetical protein
VRRSLPNLLTIGHRILFQLKPISNGFGIESHAFVERLPAAGCVPERLDRRPGRGLRLTLDRPPGGAMDFGEHIAPLDRIAAATIGRAC